MAGQYHGASDLQQESTCCGFKTYTCESLLKEFDEKEQNILVRKVCFGIAMERSRIRRDDVISGSTFALLLVDKHKNYKGKLSDWWELTRTGGVELTRTGGVELTRTGGGN